jgi:hypothetical protein
VSALRVLGVNLGLLLAGCLVLELGFGSWLVDRRISNLNLLRDRLLVHDVSSLYDHGGEPVVYRRDAYGLRGGYSSPAGIDILTVGGSTTDQKYLSEGDTWQDVLRAGFTRDGRDVSVVNAGVDGHSTRGHLRSFEWWFPTIPGLAPDFVLFFVGINDVHLDSQDEYDRLLRDDPQELSDPSWAALIHERSALFSAWRTLRGLYEAERRGVGHRRIDFTSVHWVDTPARSRHARRSLARRLAYARRLRALVEETRALGAKPIFVTQLTRSWKPLDGAIVGTAGSDDANGVDMYTITSLFNETTLEICRELHAICIDLARDLRDAFEDTDFYDFVHTTPSGARKIGDYLYESLRDDLRH